jgi:hypothetical protein
VPGSDIPTGEIACRQNITDPERQDQISDIKYIGVALRKCRDDDSAPRHSRLSKTRTEISATCFISGI